MLLPSQMYRGQSDAEWRLLMAQYLRDRFAFLTVRFGCSCLPQAEPDRIDFANATTRVILLNEYEGPYVGFDRVAAPTSPRHGCMSLMELMLMKQSSYLRRIDGGPMIDKFDVFADALPDTAADVMCGDFSIHRAYTEWWWAERNRCEARERRIDMGRVEHQAAEAFRRGDYAGCVKTLMPYLSELSPAQLQKLRIAQRRLQES